MPEEIIGSRVRSLETNEEMLSGNGVPALTAADGTYYWDYTNTELYINDSGVGTFGNSWQHIGGGGVAIPHQLLDRPWHTDTATNAPLQGAIIVADATPEWARVAHPGGAGYALVSGLATFAWDLTPAWAGTHSFALGITFNGISDANEITIPDNTIVALELLDTGGLEYLRIVSTDVQPVINFNSAAADIDFYVGANGVADALQVQGSDGQITLGVLGAGVVQSDAGGILSSAAVPLVDLASWAEGSLIIGGAVDWTTLAEPGTAGYALVSDGTTFAWDQTPEWTGDHTWISAVSAKPVLTLENTNADGSAPTVDFYKNSASPLDGDDLGAWDFFGNTSTGAKERYAYFFVESLDVTNGDTGGGMQFRVVMDAVERNLIDVAGYNGAVNEGEVVINQDAQDVDFIVEAIGVADALIVQGSDGQVTLGVLGAGFVQSTAGGVLSSAAIIAGDLPAHSHSGAAQGGSLTVGTTDTDATAGSVFFAGVAGVIQEDNANLFWDDANDVLGIRSNNPTANASGLYVPWIAGDARVTAFFGAIGAAGMNQIAVQGVSYSSGGVYGSSTTSVGVQGGSVSGIGLRATTITGTSLEVDLTGVGTIAVFQDNGAPVWSVEDGGNLLGGAAGSTITMVDDTWIGIGAALERIVFDAAGDITIMGANLGVGIAAPENIVHVYYAVNDGSEGLQLGQAGVASGYAFADGNFAIGIDQDGGSSTNFFAIYNNGLVANELFRVQEDGRVGVGIAAPLAMTHIDQSSAGAAIPVLSVDQADVSEGFINYIAASAASVVNPISTWTAGNTIQGFTRDEINGAAVWRPFYDAPTS